MASAFRGQAHRSLTAKARRILRRRQAVEPVIGHLKDDCGLRRNWLKRANGDALHPVLCAAGYNLRWLLRAIARLGLKALCTLWALLEIARRLLGQDVLRPRLEFANCSE